MSEHFMRWKMYKIKLIAQYPNLIVEEMVLTTTSHSFTWPIKYKITKYKGDKKTRLSAHVMGKDACHAIERMKKHVSKFWPTWEENAVHIVEES